MSESALTLADCLVPDWPVASRVHALCTTRRGGVSVPPFGQYENGVGMSGGLNLGLGSGDERAAVLRNRERLRELCGADIAWLAQEHGTRIVDAQAVLVAANAREERGTGVTPATRVTAPAAAPGPASADAPVPPSILLGAAVADGSATDRPHTVCAALVADCMPILLCDKAGTAVAAVHAGWRGLVAGAVEAAAARVVELAGPGCELYAWLGPAIGPHAFEVGVDVLEAFTAAANAAERLATAAAFCPRDGVPGKYWADLFALARLRLARAGAVDVRGGDRCTVSDPERFYSYRRDRLTGRMAALIWLADGGPDDPHVR